MRATHGGELVGVAEGELAQEDPQRGRRVHLIDTRGVPPARSTLTQSMLSAPHIIAAMIEVSFPAVRHTEFNPSRPQIHMLID